MPSRVRQSTVQPSQRPSTNQLPTYETPAFPLNPTAQRQLAQLTHAHNLKKLDEGFKEAQSALSNAAAEINDRLYAKQQAIAKRRGNERQNSEGAEDAEDDGLDEGLNELRDKVERMTQRMDESMRKMIDGQHNVEFIQRSVASSAENARANASTQASTQNVRSQRRRRVRSEDGEDEDDEESEEDYQDFQPTDPAGGTTGQPAPIETFRSRMDTEKTRYQNFSLTARYADNNDYRDFRRVVHDAKHPDNTVPLPHHSEWFDEGEAPAPGMTTRGRQNADEEDDDDIAVSRASISTKCPLTLQEFKTPLTSNKCPHSFESEAILSMINGSMNRENNRPNGERVVQCPVSGCSQALTRNDLHTDAVLIRQIQRIQRARELEAEDEEEEDGNARNGSTQRRSTIIDDDDADGADVDDIVEGRVVPQTQAKSEPKSTAPALRPTATAPASSAAIVNLDDSDTDEFDEDAMGNDRDIA